MTWQKPWTQQAGKLVRLTVVCRSGHICYRVVGIVSLPRLVKCDSVMLLQSVVWPLAPVGTDCQPPVHPLTALSC